MLGGELPLQVSAGLSSRASQQRLKCPKVVPSYLYTGHETTMSKMKADLSLQQDQAVRVILLSGPPGMGKTQRAKKFISSNYQGCPLMIVQAENSVVFHKSLREFADHMQLLPFADKVEPKVVAECVANYFEQNYADTNCRGAILIDNFESHGLHPLRWGYVLQCLPEVGVDLIATSRSGEIPVATMQMPKLDREDSKRLLMKMLSPNDEDDAASDEAAEFCDDCPLALTLFAGFCHGCWSMKGGLQHLREGGRGGVVAILEGEVNTSFLDGYPHTLQIWRQIIQQMEADEEAAVHLLAFASCLHADGIPRTLLESFMTRLLEDCHKEMSFQEVLRILVNRNLVQSDMRDDPRITIHRFVQAAAQLHLKDVKSKEVLQLVFKHGVKICREYAPLARYAARDMRLLALESLVHMESFASKFAELGFGANQDIVLLQIELADYYVRLVGTPTEAMRIIHCAETQLKGCEDSRLLALLFAKKCYCFLTGCSQTDLAKEALDTALRYAHQSEDKEVLMRVYYEAVRLCQLQGLDSDVAQYQSKLQTLCSCDETSRLARADCHKLLGHSLLHRADRSAILHYKKALEIYQAEVGEKHPCVAKILAAMGPAHRDTYDYGMDGAKMLDPMKTALEIEQNSGMAFDLPWFRQTMGHMYTLLPRFAENLQCSTDDRVQCWKQEAQEHIAEAKRLFETIAQEQRGTTHFAGTRRIEAEYILAFEPARVDEALCLCKEALSLYDACLGKSTRSAYIARVHVVEGWAYLKKQNATKQAIVCFGKALTVLQGEISVRVADVHYWLGHSHSLLQNLETAQHHLKLSLEILDKLSPDHPHVFWRSVCQRKLDEVLALHGGLLKIQQCVVTSKRYLLFTQILFCQVLGLRKMLLWMVSILALCLSYLYFLPVRQTLFEALFLSVIAFVFQHPNQSRNFWTLLRFMPSMLRSQECAKPLAFVEVSPGDKMKTGFKEMCNHVDIEGHLATHGAVLFRGWLSNPTGPTFQETTDTLMERLQMTEHMFEGGYNPRILVPGTRCIFAPKSPLVCEQESVATGAVEGLAARLGCIWDSPNWRKYVDSHHTEMAYSADKPDLFALYCQEAPSVGGGIMLSDECNVLQCLKRHPLGESVLHHIDLDNFVLHDCLPQDEPLVTDSLSAKQYFAHSPLHSRHGDVSEGDRDEFLAKCWGDTGKRRDEIIARNGYELQKKDAFCQQAEPTCWDSMLPQLSVLVSMLLIAIVWNVTESRVESLLLALLPLGFSLLRRPFNGEQRSGTAGNRNEADSKKTKKMRIVSNSIKIEKTLPGSKDKGVLGFFAPFYGAVYKDTQQEPSVMDKTIVAISHWLSSSHIAIQKGDIVLVDNNRVAHTRGLPFVGKRVVYSAQFRRAKQVSIRELLACCIRAAQRAGVVIQKEQSQREGVQAYVKTAEGKQGKLELRAQLSILKCLKSRYPQAVIVAEESEAKSEASELDECPWDSAEEIDVGLETPPDLAECSWDDLTIWVDPLDGTKEFARGNLECVTVLIGISFKNVPVAGVIHQPFRRSFDGDLGSCTTWGIVGAGVRSTRLGEISSAPASDRPVAVLSESKKDSEIVLKTLERLPTNTEIQRAGGCGNKLVQVIEQRADFMLQAPGSQRWDSAAGEAILRALGGGLCSLDGESYLYAREGSHRNQGGLIACRSSSCLEFAKPAA